MNTRSSSPYRPRAAGERGIALLIVLLLSMVLIPFAAEFAFQIDMEAKTAHNVKDQLMLDNAIEGQYQVMLARFSHDAKGNESDSYNDTWNDDELLSRTEEATSVQLTTKVWDEKGKMNLRMLVEGPTDSQQIWKERFVELLRRFRADTDWDAGSYADELVADIVRYLKGESRGNIPKPNTIDDRAMLVLEELNFVNELVEKHSLLVDRSEGESSAHGLHRYITLHGDGRVNVNTAPATVLYAMFPQNEEIAEDIISRREGSGEEEDIGVNRRSDEDVEEGSGNPFTDVNQINELESVTQQTLRANKVVLSRDFDVMSHFYSIRIRGNTNRTHREEVFFLERVPGQDPNGEIEGFRHLMCQERTDPLVETVEEQDF